METFSFSDSETVASSHDGRAGAEDSSSDENGKGISSKHKGKRLYDVKKLYIAYRKRGQVIYRKLPLISPIAFKPLQLQAYLSANQKKYIFWLVITRPSLIGRIYFD